MAESAQVFTHQFGKVPEEKVVAQIKFTDSDSWKFAMTMFSIVCALVGFGYWGAMTYETKNDATAARGEIVRSLNDAIKSESSQSFQRSQDLDRRIQVLETNLSNIGRDVSYVRGKLENK